VKTIVIPVVKQGTWKVWESDDFAKGKLSELQAYLQHIPNKLGYSVPDLTRMILEHVGEVIETGTNVYYTNVGGVDEEVHGKLVFVQSSFRTAGMTFTWRVIAKDVDGYLERAFAQGVSDE
jgi:hypothetical protein